VLQDVAAKSESQVGAMAALIWTVPRIPTILPCELIQMTPFRLDYPLEHFASNSASSVPQKKILTCQGGGSWLDRVVPHAIFNIDIPDVQLERQQPCLNLTGAESP
jgi:hypothetical protein